MAKIAVTGANGQLGSSLRVVKDHFPGHTLYFTDIQDLDLTDKKKTAAYLRNINPDYLVHCAAYTNVDKAEEEPESVFMLNRDVPAFLAVMSETYDFRIIHISTDYVYSGQDFLPYSEEYPASPRSVYGHSKLAGEQMLNEIPAVILRTSWLYSEFGHNFVKTILQLARTRESIDVVYDQIGSPTYALDLAMTILTVIDKTEKKSMSWMPGIYHYANEGVCSWYDFANEIIRLSGLSCHVQPVRTDRFPRPASRPAFSVLAKEKIKQTYSISIPYWKESLEKCIIQLKSDNHGR